MDTDDLIKELARCDVGTCATVVVGAKKVTIIVAAIERPVPSGLFAYIGHRLGVNSEAG